MFDIGKSFLNPDLSAFSSLIWWLAQSNYLQVIYYGYRPSLFLSFAPYYYGNPHPTIIVSMDQDVDELEWAKYATENSVYNGATNPFWMNMKLSINEKFVEQISQKYDVRAVLSIFYDPYAHYLSGLPEPWVIVPPSGIGIHRIDCPLFFHAYQMSAFIDYFDSSSNLPQKCKIIPGFFPLPERTKINTRVMDSFKAILCLDQQAFNLCQLQNPHVWIVGNQQLQIHMPAFNRFSRHQGTNFTQNIQNGSYLMTIINSSDARSIPYLAFAGLYEGIPVCLGPQAYLWKAYFTEKHLPFFELEDDSEESVQRVVERAFRCNRSWISARTFEVFTPHSLAIYLAEELCS